MPLGTRAWSAADRVRSRHCLPALEAKFPFGPIDEGDADLPTIVAVDIANFGPGVDGCGSSSFDKRHIGRRHAAIAFTGPAIRLTLLRVVIAWNESVVSIGESEEQTLLTRS